MIDTIDTVFDRERTHPAELVIIRPTCEVAGRFHCYLSGQASGRWSPWFTGDRDVGALSSEHDSSPAASPATPDLGGAAGPTEVVPGAGLQPPTPSEAIPRLAYLGIAALSLALGLTGIVRGTRELSTASDSDLTNFFFKSAQYVARGDPWHLYAIRGDRPLQLFPNDGMPLPIFLMAPLVHVLQFVPHNANLGVRFVVLSAPFILLVPLLGYLALTTLDRSRPALPPGDRLLAFALLTLSPLAWLCYSPWGHLEQPLQLCFLLLAVGMVQRRRPAAGGLLAGLALLSGITSAYPLLALFTLLLAQRAWRIGLVAAGLCGGVFLLGMLPFVLVDRIDTVYALVGWHGGVQFGGNSIWSLFTGGTLSHLPHSILAGLRRLDTPLMVLASMGVALVASRRLGISAYRPEAWSVLAIAALSLPMLNKLNWPYYFLQPFVLLLIAECATGRDNGSMWCRRPFISLGYMTVCATLASYIGLRSTGALDRMGLGLLVFAVMLGCGILMWERLRRLRLPAEALAYHLRGVP
jgi:hypothetical protein